MKCLVTGGAGFIGSHLVDELISQGHVVTIIDDLSTGQKKNINPKSEFIEADISERYRIGGIVVRVKPDWIFHLAAMARIGDCHNRPIDSYKVNVLGTLYLLEAAREVGAKGFTFSSSSAVYGNTAPGKPLSEVRSRVPISMYGLQKLNAENLVLRYGSIYGLQTIALRYFNVYGTARQNPAGAYPNVFAAFGRDAREKGKITIYGTGEQQRDYVHVSDVVAANIATTTANPLFYGTAINIGTGVTHTVNQIADHFPVEREYKEARVGDPQYSCAEIDAARAALKWDPKISFETGINLFQLSLKEAYNE